MWEKTISLTSQTDTTRSLPSETLLYIKKILKNQTRQKTDMTFHTAGTEFWPNKVAKTYNLGCCEKEEDQ